MKKFTFLTALAALLLLPSPAKAQLSLPVTMDFENETAYNTWTVVNSPTDWNDEPATTRISGSAHDGSYCFRFYYSTNPPQYLISPELSPLSGPAQVVFWHKAQSTSFTESFMLGWSSTTSDTSAFSWSTEVTTNVTSYQKYEGIVPAGTKYVCIKYTANNQYYLYIDDIVIQNPPSCLPVSGLTTTAVDSANITLSWTDLLNEDGVSYSVAYWSTADTTWTTATDTFLTISDLNASTAYHFMVRATCTATDSSEAVSATFRTDCGLMPMPFTDNFDSYENGVFPPCWHRVRAHNTDPSVNNVFHHSGTMSMFLKAYNDTTLFVSPSKVPLAGDQIYVNYWAYMPQISSGTKWIKAGVMTDTSDFSTFITLDSIGNHNFNYEFEEHEFTTAGLDPTAEYWVAWMYYNSYYAYYGNLDAGAIDDVIIRQDNGCNKPNMAVVDSVGPYTAYLSWTTGGNGATAYDLFYGTLNNIDSAAVVNVTDLADTVHYALTGLLPQTTYYAWVRTACGNDNADAKAIGSFTTQLTCAPVITAAMGNISYIAAQMEWAYDTTQGFPTEGIQITLVDNTDNSSTPVVVVVEGTSYTFNDLAAGHSYTATLRNLCQAESQMDTATAVTVSFMTTSCAEIAANTGSVYEVPFDNYYNYSYAQMIYRANEMPSIDTIRGIAFNLLTGRSGYGDTIDIYLGYIDTTAFASNTAWIADSNLTHVAHVRYDLSNAGWYAVAFDSVFVYNGTGNLVVAVNNITSGYPGDSYKWANHAGTNQTLSVRRDNTGAYDPANPGEGTLRNVVPDIRFVADCEVPSCFAPMLTLGTVDSVSIAVTWVSTGTENEWAVGYKAEGATAVTWADNTVTDLAYTFGNLTPNTLYTLYVGSLCNGDTLMASLNVKTTCGAMSLPYSTSFEGDVVDEAPSCWTVVNSYSYGTYDYSTWNYIYVDYPAVSTGAHTGTKSLGFLSENVSTLIASSALPANGEALTVSFWAQTDDNDYATLTLEAGLMTDLASASTFVPMVTLTGSNDYALHEFVTPELSSDSTYYLAFRYIADDNYWANADVDDIEIRLDDGCHRSTNVVALGTDVDEIDVTWTNDNLTNEYVVRYSQRGTNSWTTLNNIYTTSTTLTLLDTATAYEIMVGTVCATDTLWTLAVTAKTTCAPMVLPYSNSFENDIPGDMPACWNNSGATGADYYGATYPSVIDNEAHTGDNALAFTYINGTSIVSSEAVPLAGDSIHVSFWAMIETNTFYGSPMIEAGVMTNPAIDTTFIPLDTVTSTSYQLYEFNTSALNHNEVYYVVFRYTSASNNLSAYVDDINIRLFEGCMYPTNIVATPAGNSVSLTWSNNGSTTDFAIQYRAAGAANWTAVNSVSTTTASISSLNASTAYEVRVGTICGTDTLWANATFTTDCGLLAVPYFEDFDNYANDVMPPCWIWSSTYATHWDGGVFLKSYHGGGSEYVVLPQLDGAISKLKIEFDTKVGTIAENDGILIGVADANGALLVWLDTIQDANFSRNQHVRKTVYFPNYSARMPANAARVAFAQYRNWGEWALIDNINIEVLPDCYPVDNLVGHNLDDIENTTFTWHPMGGATQWQVYVDTVTVGIDSLANLPDSLFIDVYDTTYTLPIGTIQGGGIYNFFVRSNCGQMQSSWVKNEFGAGTIIMNQATDTVTGCGFVVYDNGGPIAGYLAPSSNELVLRTENAGSQLQIFGGKFGFGSSPATLTVYDGEGTNGTVLFTYNTVDGRDTMLNTNLATSTTGSLTITFSVSGNMAHTGYELYIRCTDGALCPRPTELQAEMTSATTATATWTGSASNYNFYYRIHNAGTWVRIPTTTNSANLTGLTADTVYDMYVMALCSTTDSSSASATRQLRTVWTEPQPECDVVTNVTVSDITVTSAKIAWTAPAGQTRWEIDYGVNTVEVTTNPYTLTGLSDSTAYTVKVRALCGEGMASEWSDATSFTTLHQHEGIDDVNTSHIALFPNPASSTVTLMGIEGQATVTVVDMNGREAGKWIVNDGELTIDVTDFAQGTYFVRIVGEQVNAIRKLIVR